MKPNSSLFSSLILTIPSILYAKDKEFPTQKPNVVFICVDDLRRELGVYGSSVQTPNIDRLAQKGSCFTHHYVQVPTSGASRASMLTGMLPKKQSDLSNEACRINLSNKAETNQPETMFHHLRRNGYYTVSIGKISHSADGYLYGYNQPQGEKRELPYSWSEIIFDAGKWKNGWNAFFGYSDGSNRNSKKNQTKPYECAEVSDENYPDGLTAQKAIEQIKILSSKDQPYCLAVGFYKPHLPFTAPKKYWDLYDREEINTSLAPSIPINGNLIALHNSNEFNQYKLGDENPNLSNPASEAYAKKLIHAYYACISYMDAQVGKILQAIDDSGEEENTIIVLWGDHGWHLGDHQVWGKHTLYETALNSSLIITAPQIKPNVINKRIVSSIDIYPTLMELCHVTIPPHLDGKSFVQLLHNPRDKKWKDESFGFFKNGTTIRTKDYRLLHYKAPKDTIIELYQYDKYRLEKKNIASQRKSTVDKLTQKIRQVRIF